MYKRELQIIFNEADDKIKKGAFFEELVARVFRTQRYKIKERVNFTGMEIDLIAEHFDRSNEEIYIECKAKENLSSAEIKSFTFNTQFRKKKYGYFISVIDFTHQVSGLIEEMRNMVGYDNLYFFGPDKIIEFLTEAKFIEREEPTIFDTKPSKLIVVYSYFGIFKIYLFSKGTISTEFTVLDHMNKVVTDSFVIKQLEKYVTEVADLEYFEIKAGYVVEDKDNKKEESKLIESVAEVKRSEAWFDYLPTSQKHFVGRKDILEKYDGFIKSIKDNESEKRVFYIEGKSGWGKSSFVSAIRDKSLGKEGKKTEFVFAVDTRSASTTNFIALAFKKMLTAAKDAGFLAGFKNIEDIKIVSSFDILGSDSIKELFIYLKTNKKYLVIIFDQFEDIFRAESIFKVFYKFLIDTNNLCANLVVGFSWKTEITVPIQHEAYHLWQVLKSETFCIEMRSFDALEVNGVINQLQKSLDFKLDSNIKRRIIESSQGFPWLTKKLCIHTYNEFHKGISIDELMEQELNIKSLFDKDLEGLNSEELKALRFIAKRAFDGNMFDVTEMDDVISDAILFSLINKRLVIRSGQKYNIYWDIFRDYLVNDKITLIGESYILRVKPNICFDIFGYFKLDKKVEFEELKEAYKGRYTEKTLYNILRQLLDVGLISKNNTTYQINKNIESIDKSSYVEFLQKKFQRYTPYLKLIDREELKSLRNVMDILQDTFRGIDLKDLTWEVYTKTFISWIDYLGLKGIENIEMYSFETIENGQLRSRKTKNQVVTFTPQKPIRDDIMVLKEIAFRKDGFNIKNHSKFLYDLSAIGVLYYWKDDVIITKNGQKALACKTEKEFFEYIAQLAIKMDKIDKAVKIIMENDIQNIQEFRKTASSLVDHINSDIYKRQTLGKIYNWANFIVDISHE